MSFPERHFHTGMLALSCLALALAGCGGGGGGGGGATVGDVGGAESQGRTDEAASEPLVIAAALPTEATNPATANPFEIPDPDAPAPPEAPSGATPGPVETELPTHAPDGTPYCD